jgi:hypothetical protein
MAGILDDTPVGVLDPRSMALTRMGLDLLGSSGPSLVPTSFGQNIGRAGGQGIESFQQANQANQQQQLVAMKMAEAKRAEAAGLQQAAARARLAQDPRFAQFAPLLEAGVPPQALIEHAFPKPEKPQGPMSDLGKLEDDFRNKRISPGDYAAKKAKLVAPAQPLVTVDNRQPTKFNEEVGKQLGEQYAGLMKADFSAPATIGKYEQLGSLLSNVNTGKFAGTTADLKAVAKGVGINLDAMGVRDDVAPAQAAKALSNNLALELRNPSGGAGMPGAMSDQDREFLKQMVPNIENDAKAIKTMIEYRVQLAKREQQVARMARAYRKKHGNFDEGFFDELQDWSNKNRMFPDLPKTAAPSSQGGVIDFGSLK